MENNKLLKMCRTAMFAALICVSTIIIQIPSPLGGYINLGDSFIVAASVFLSPLFAFTAGSLGSALADILTGYTIYAPATFIIKGLMALTISFMYKALLKKGGKLSRYAVSLSAVPAEIIMIIGYYLFSALISGGFIAALQTVPGNAVQGLAGIICGSAITFAIKKAGALSAFKQ